MRRQPPPTRLTLVAALRQGLRWEEFVALYGRLILSWGRSDFGLQACDADNLCQEVLLRVWRGIGTFDPARGRFRAWLYACARNAACNLRRGQPPERVGIFPDDLRATIDPNGVSADAGSLDAAVAQLEADGFAVDALQQAVSAVRARVQPTTWKAFLLSEFFDLTAKDIAGLLAMQPVAVSQAVFRVRQLLKRCLIEVPDLLPCTKESGQ
jgi:RNA polymerase sigma-70 factor (ECF subfamily)